MPVQAMGESFLGMLIMLPVFGLATIKLGGFAIVAATIVRLFRPRRAADA